MPMRVFALFSVLLSVPNLVSGQTTPARTGEAALRLRVFLDCNCFDEYLRDEIRWVDFVRQPQDADVQIISTASDTGGGGQEVTVRLIGLGRHQGTDHTLRVMSLPADSEDLRRRNVLRTVSVGLLGYLAREGLPPDIVLSVRAADVSGPARVTVDRWRNWVFGVSADASLEAEESNRESNWEVGASADHVTARWKVSAGVSIDQQTERFDLDEDDPVSVTRRERRGDGFVARSLGEHWSFGVRSSVASSTFSNVKFSAEARPIVEFNVFPYSQYATRQLRLQYGAGVQRTSYNEVTLFDKLRETLGQHALVAVLDQRQPWGTLQARTEWSQYLHDRHLYRLQVDGEVSFRVARGFSVDLEMSASRIRDQISLPRRGARPEEILLRLRELQSGYEVEAQFGVRYTFGSIFNNIVNPRFGN